MKIISLLSGKSLIVCNLHQLLKVNFYITSLYGLLAMTFILPVNTVAQGNLLVTPRRIVFDGTKRSIDLNLANIGQDTATYAITLVQMRMKYDGRL